MIFLGSFANNGEDVSAFHESPIIMEDSPSAVIIPQLRRAVRRNGRVWGKKVGSPKVPFLLRKTN